MKFLTELFAWWTGNTIGTRLFTWRYGTRVGADGSGNVYYQTDDGKRRWVIYRDQSEASLVPPEWHGWLHYTVDVPPTDEAYNPRPWQQPYVPNLTGSPEAYRPPGSIRNPDTGKTPQRDYEPWQPK
jgi:NADH:ubiquinone oxidoreductase subunit